MTRPVTLYTLTFELATALLIGAAVYTWRQRHYRPAWLAGVVMLVAGAEWALINALEAASRSLLTMILLDKLKYLGIVTIPTTWLIYVSRYTSQDRWLTRRARVLLGSVPLLAVVLVFTNDLHHGQ